MPFPTVSDAMAGELEIIITHADNSVVTINPNFIGSITPAFTQLVRTSERLSGSASRPTNQLDNPTATISLFLNQWSDVQYLMPESMDGETFVLGSGGNCTLPEPASVTFHYACDDDAARDITLPVTYIGFEDTNERTATDEVAVNFILYPQANPAGQVVYGELAS